MFRDFKAIKANVSIERAMVYLNLKGLTADNGTYRGECPTCRAGTRSLVITPEKDSFYCHAAKKGGDVISLVAHLHGTSMKDAAGFLEDKHARAAKPEKTPKTEEPTGKTGDFQPLKGLSYDHEKVQALGLSAEDAERLGIGYCSRGYYRGHVVAPIRTDTGHLCVYAIISTEKPMPKTLHWPESNVVPITKRRAS